MKLKLCTIAFGAVIGAAAFIATLIGPASAAEKVTLRLDYLPQGYHAPLFYGVAKGFYKDQGIDLEIADSQGSNAALQAVAAGANMIVMANYAIMAQSVVQGMPVVAVGGLIQRLPDAIIALKGSGITKPKDMEGKSMSIPPTSAVFKLFPAFVSATGVDINKIKLVQMSAAATHSALLQGQVDFTTGWAFTQGVQIAHYKPIEPPILMYDYGINMLGAGFIVTRATAASKKDVLKHFIAATAKAYSEGTQHPDEAVDALLAARPQIEKATAVEQLKLLPPYLQSNRTKGHPFGWMSRDDWSQTADILEKYFETAKIENVDQLFSNEFASQ